MRYLGGKTRQAAWLRKEICARRGLHSVYVEPFMGGGSVLQALAPEFENVIACDVVPDLIALWSAVCSGWVPPNHIEREDYDRLREAEPSALRAWAGFAASYNGKWFSGYGPKAAGRDYLSEAVRGVVKKASSFKHARLACLSYDRLNIDSRCVVYCDPPYAGTEGYGAAPSFDHSLFWSTMDKWVAAGATVLVSEFTAPSHWREVSSVERKTLDHASSNTRREILWGRG